VYPRHASLNTFNVLCVLTSLQCLVLVMTRVLILQHRRRMYIMQTIFCDCLGSPMCGVWWAMGHTGMGHAMMCRQRAHSLWVYDGYRAFICVCYHGCSSSPPDYSLLPWLQLVPTWLQFVTMAAARPHLATVCYHGCSLSPPGYSLLPWLQLVPTYSNCSHLPPRSGQFLLGLLTYIFTKWH